jgi:hypothetical protein
MYDPIYERINWENEEVSRKTALGAINLNKMDYALYEHDKRIVNMDSRLESQEQTLSTIEGIASASAKSASESAASASLSATTAKLEAERAKTYADNAEAVTGIEIATKERAGIIKGGDILIDEGGVLQFTTTTTSRELTESQAGGIRIISMDGESQQKQYSGKNLGNLDDRTITAGTNAYAFTSWVIANYIKTNMTYTVSFYTDFTSNMSVNVYDANISAWGAGSNEVKPSNGRASFTFKTDDNLTNFNKLLIYAGVTGITAGNTVKVWDIQIEQGSTMTEYEPYVGGIASPNPEYEQDIDSVEISEIWSHGRNLEYNSATYEGWNVWNWDGTITGETYNGGKVIKYTKDWQFRYPPSRNFKAGTYTISFDARVKTSGNAHVYSSGLGVSKSIWITASNNFSRHSFTFTLTEDKRGWITVIIPTGSTVGELYVANIQVEYGSETEYEPYTETRETLSAPIVLRGIGDAKDVLCKMNGVYGVLRNIWGVFLADLSWGLRPDITSSTTTIDMYQTNSLENTVVAGVGLCSHTSRITSSLWSVTHETFSINDKYLRFTLDRTRLTNSTASASNFINWLRENNVEAILRLATPTFEPLPLADQIALHKLETFGGVTYLFTDSTIEPIIEVEYGTSKVGGYAIKGLNTADANALMIEQLKTLTNELATQIVAGSEG